MHEDKVRLLSFQKGRKVRHDLDHNMLQRLVLDHDIEVVIGSNFEKLHHLVEHAAVLGGDGHDRLEILWRAHRPRTTGAI